MGALVRWCWFSIGSGFLMSCGPAERKSSVWADWSPEVNAYAKHFRLWHRGSDRLVLVFGHGGEPDTVGCYWVTDLGDTDPPPIGAIRIPRRPGSIACGSTTHVPYLQALDGNGAIVACAHAVAVRDSAFQRSVAMGRVRELVSGEGLDRELLLTIQPDVLTAYPFGRQEGADMGRWGVPVVEVGEYLEEHPLGRAEWLRFFGVIMGAERTADSLFEGIRERYEALRVPPSEAPRPKVIFGSVWNGQWWVPPGNSLMARLIEDAGGEYVFRSRTGDGNIAMDMESMIDAGRDADHWGMIAEIATVVDERSFTGGDARLSDFRSVRNGGLFIGNTAEDDLFGRALLEPDRVLLSLRRILQPDTVVYGSGQASGYFRSVVGRPRPSP